MQVEVAFVQFCIRFLEEINPNLIRRARGKFWLGQGLAGNKVIDRDTLPLSVFAESQAVDPVGIDLIVIVEKSFEEGLIGEGEADDDWVEGVICQFALDEVIVIHTVDKGVVRIVNIGRSPPMVDRVID